MIELVIGQRRRNIGSFEVARILPFSKRRMIGPSIFFDHMGPVDLPEGLHIGLSYAGVHAEDCAVCDTEVRMVSLIEMEISFLGNLSEDQQRRLMEIANKCPVHRTLTNKIQISTTRV